MDLGPFASGMRAALGERRDRAFDGLQEDRSVKRLAQIRARASRKAGFLGACFVVAGDHHNRHACTDRGQVLLNLQAAHFGHLHVKHQAIRCMLIKIVEEFPPGAIGFRSMVRAAQKAPQGGSDSFVVIDDGNVVRALTLHPLCSCSYAMTLPPDQFQSGAQGTRARHLGIASHSCPFTSRAPPHETGMPWEERFHPLSNSRDGQASRWHARSASCLSWRRGTLLTSTCEFRRKSCRVTEIGNIAEARESFHSPMSDTSRSYACQAEIAQMDLGLIPIFFV